MYVMWKGVLIPFHVAVQFCQHHLLDRLYFIHYIVLSPLSYINWPQVGGLFLGFLFCSIDLCVCFCARTMLFWLAQRCSIVKSGKVTIFSRLLWKFRIFCGFFLLLNSGFDVSSFPNSFMCMSGYLKFCFLR